MAEITAYRGLNCTTCPAYQATQKDDDEERRRVAEVWSKEFGVEIKPEHINCDGCLEPEGRHIAYCDQCKIRACAMEKGVVNCAHCGDYACDELKGFFKMAPDAEKHLEEIRTTL